MVLRFVYAHAECDGSADDFAVLVVHPRVLNLAAFAVIHAGVVWQRLDAAIAQRCTGGLALVPRYAIYDAALVQVLALYHLNDLLQCSCRALLVLYLYGEYIFKSLLKNFVCFCQSNC